MELIALISSQYIDSVFSHRFSELQRKKEMLVILLIEAGEHPKVPCKCSAEDVVQFRGGGLSQMRSWVGMALLCNLLCGNEQSHFLWIWRGCIKDNGTPWDRLSLKLGQSMWLSDLIMCAVIKPTTSEV